MDRTETLKDLIEFRKPLYTAIADIRSFPWDSDEEFVTVDPAVLGRALRMFLEGTLSPQELEDWANAIEGRDDIAFDPADAMEVVVELANPILYRPLNEDTAMSLLTRVQAQSATGAS